MTKKEIIEEVKEIPIEETKSEKEETREQAFIRIATRRTQKIISQLRLLGNLGNKSNYNYTKDQIDKMVNSIQTSLKIALSKFTFVDIPKSSSEKFSF